MICCLHFTLGMNHLGTPGSLGSFVGIDLEIPILTIEYERGKDQALTWSETRSAILAVIRGS